MAINAGAVKNNGNKKFVEQPTMEEGQYPGRLVQIIDLGLQPQRAFKGESKPPAHQVMFTFELVDSFLVDEKGEDILDKPRWVSVTMPLRPFTSDLANSTKLAKALDPTDSCQGDFEQMIGFPVMVGIGIDVKGDKTYTNIVGFAAMRARDASKCPELVNPPKIFILESPDMEVFNALPEWIREKIKSNLEYAHSNLQRIIEGEVPQEQPANKKRQEQPKVETEEPDLGESDEDLPW